MKRFISIMLSLVIVFAVFSSVPYTESPFGVLAKATDESGIGYIFDDVTQTYRVVSFSYSGVSDIVIPTEFEGYPVTIINVRAFEDQTDIVSVTIPDTIVGIGPHAFAGCESLKTVTISSDNAPIDYYAFDGCTALETVTFSENSVSSIDMYAFNGCTSITELILPEGLTEIGERAFLRCESLKSVSIPSSVRVIGTDAFDYCEAFETAYIADLASWCGVSLGSAEASPVAWAPQVYFNNELITDLVIPEGVEAIGDFCFGAYDGFKSVTFPDSLKSIGQGCFKYCYGLETVTLNKGLESIGSEAFYNCSALKTINVPSLADWCEIFFTDEYSLPVCCGGKLYVNDVELTEITVPEGVEEIKQFSFANFSAYSSITIPGSVKKIGAHAFGNCTGLTSFIVPEGVEAIDGGAFLQCRNLAYVEFPSTLTEIGDWAFFGCGALNEITFNTKQVLVPENVFYDCEEIEIINIPDMASWCGVSFATNSANPLNGGAKLYIDDILQTEIVIPEGVTSIGSCTFANYDEAVSISLPASLNTFSALSFYGCDNIASVSVNENSQYFTCVDDVLYTKDMLQLVYYPLAKEGESYTIPEGTTTISEFAFYGCSGLSELIIPASIISVGANATGNCTNLKYLFFLGISEQWSTVSISDGNVISSLPVHFSTTEHTAIDDWSLSENNSCTNGKENYLVIKCQYCSYIFETKVIPAGHFFENNICRVCGVTEYEYKKNSDKDGIIITAYNGNAADVVIPSVFEDLPVVTINSEAFAENESIVTVEVPETVEEINSSAFYDCPKLENVILPSGLIELGESAFAYCESLKSVNLPLGLLCINYSTFSQCSALTDVTIPDNVIEIGEMAFMNCVGLKAVELPATLTKIGERAFYNCDALEEIVIPSSVTEIGDYAFRYCTSLKTVDFYPAACLVGRFAFDSSSIETVKVNSIPAWCGNSFSNYEANPLYHAENFYVGGNPVTSLTIPNGVASINSYAFSGFEGFDSVTISNSVLDIGSDAFSYCSGIETVKLPRALKTIKERTFFLCESLKTVEIPSYLSVIEKEAFSKCSSLESISLPSNLTTIGESAFSGCTGLKSIDLPSNLTTLGAWAFSGCDGLKSIVIPSKVSKIGGLAFWRCKGLETVEISEGVQTIGNDAFKECTALEEAILPTSIKTINAFAFMYCDNYKYTFFAGDESQWASISIGENTALEESVIHFNSTGHTPSEYWTYDEDFDCLSSTERFRWKICAHCDYVVVKEEIPEGHQFVNDVCENCGSSDYLYTVSDGVATLTGVRTEITDFVVPTMLGGYPVVAVGASAFSGCETLRSLVVPEGVEIIMENAFSDCNNLESITIAESVTELGANAFKNCCNLYDIALPTDNINLYSTAFENTGYYNTSENWTNGALYIGNYLVDVEDTKQGEFVIKDGTKIIANGSFANCTLIEKVTMADSVEKYEDGPFSTCAGLKIIDLGLGVDDISVVISGVPSLESIVVPGKFDTISNTDFSTNMTIKSIVLEEGVKTIGANTFKDMKNLVSVSIPQSVTIIGESAFQNCASLLEVSIPSDVTVIQPYTFFGCSSLTTIQLHNNITEIGDRAFYNCSNLEAIDLPGGIITIPYGTFYNCKSLKSINLPDSITQIGSNAFYKCSGLTQMNIPCGVTEIGANAFYGCSGIKEFVLPDTLTSIGDAAFRSCASMERLVIPDSVTSMGKNLITDCTSLKKVVIGDGVSSVGTIFKNNTSIENVIIGSGVNTIDNYAFSGCSALKYLSLGKNVTTLNNNMLYGCTSLAYMVVPKTVTTIGASAFKSFKGTIVCKDGSTVHTYAQEKGISYLIAEITAVSDSTSVETDEICVFTDIYQCENIDSLVTTPSPMKLSVELSGLAAQSGCIGTNAVITHTIEECIIDEYTVIVRGDLNSDGVCDVLDAALAAQYSSGIKTASQAEIYAANGDVAETIDVEDYQAVVNKALS